MTREQKLRLIYRHTHSDYKHNGSILILRDGATCSVPLSLLTDSEIESELPYALKQEAKRSNRSAA